MARRSPPKPPQRAELSPQHVERGIQLIKRRVADLEAFDATSVGEADPKVDGLETSIRTTLQRVFGSDSAEFVNYRGAATLSPQVFFGTMQPHHYRGAAIDGKARALELLNSAIQFLEEELEFLDASSTSLVEPSASSKTDNHKVFVVHGHDSEAKQAVARFLEKLGLEAIILHEKENEGRTLIEKFERHADVGYAVVLVTPDDVGAPKERPDQLRLRARQNVIFELGFFVGRLGRHRVCALLRGDIEWPSDFEGVIYKRLEEGDWQMTLFKEMRAAGLELDANKMF